MRLKNNIFAAAFDELKRNHGVKTQKQLARMMGVSEDTITRILKDRTDVTEDIITKLQTASGCIFNLQWLRGEDAAPMLAKDEHQAEPQQQPHMDHSSLVNALVAAKDETIESLKRELASKDEQIAAISSELSTLNEAFTVMKERVQEYRRIIDNRATGDYIFPVGAAEPNKPTAK